MSTATESRPKPFAIEKPRYRTIINADGQAIVVPDYDGDTREDEARAEREREEARERVRAMRPRPGAPRRRPDFGSDDYRIGSRDALRSFADQTRGYDPSRYGGGMTTPAQSGCSCDDCKRERGESQQPQPCNECTRLNEKVRQLDARIVAQVDATQKIDKEADALAAEFERVVEQNAELRESIEWYSNEIMLAWEKIEEFNALAA